MKLSEMERKIARRRPKLKRHRRLVAGTTVTQKKKRVTSRLVELDAENKRLRAEVEKLKHELDAENKRLRAKVEKLKHELKQLITSRG